MKLENEGLTTFKSYKCSDLVKYRNQLDEIGYEYDKLCGIYNKNKTIFRDLYILSGIINADLHKKLNHK
jgi:hypothetical protein